MTQDERSEAGGAITFRPPKDYPALNPSAARLLLQILRPVGPVIDHGRDSDMIKEAS